VKLFLLKQTCKSFLFLSETMDILCRAGSVQQAQQSTHLAKGLNPLSTNVQSSISFLSVTTSFQIASCYFISCTMDYFQAGDDQPRTDQPNKQTSS